MLIKAAQDNPEIQTLYKDFLDKPLSERAHSLLHTEGYIDRSSDLGPNGACTPETCPTSVANLRKAMQGKK